MRVTDAHVHFFETDRYRYSWLEEEGMAGITRPFGPDDYLAIAADGPVDVTATVHVHAEPDQDTDQLALLRHLQELQEEKGLPSAAIGWADLSAPDFPDRLTALAEIEVFRGVRQHVFHPPPGEEYPTQAPRPHMMAEERWRAGFTELGERGFTFDLLFWSNQLPEAVDLLEECAGTTVVIEHALFPSIWPSLETWQQAIRALPAHDNVYAKVSAFGQMGTVTTDKVQPYIQELLDHFGTDHVMLASNFPVDRLHSSWDQLWNAYLGAVSGLSVTEQDQVLRSNALDAYGIAGA